VHLVGFIIRICDRVLIAYIVMNNHSATLQCFEKICGNFCSWKPLTFITLQEKSKKLNYGSKDILPITTLISAINLLSLGELF